MNENETLVYSASGRTTHFNLPLYHAEDKVKYLTDWNISMEEIDKLLFEMKSSGDINKTDIASIKERLTIAENAIETTKTDLASLTQSVGGNSADIEQIQKDLIAQNSLVKTMSETIITIQNTLDEYEERIAILEGKIGLVYPNVIMNGTKGDKYFPVAVYGNQIRHGNAGVVAYIPKPDESMGDIMLRINLYHGSEDSDAGPVGSNIWGHAPYIKAIINSSGLKSYTVYPGVTAYQRVIYPDRPSVSWSGDSVQVPINFSNQRFVSYTFTVTQETIRNEGDEVVAYGVSVTVSTNDEPGQMMGYFDVKSVECFQSKLHPNVSEISGASTFSIRSNGTNSKEYELVSDFCKKYEEWIEYTE